MSGMRHHILAFVVVLCPAVAFGQRAPFPIPDPDPEVERRSFLVADGFEVNLFAADPVLAKPIQMNFDPQGRLWVVSSEVYPQIEPGQKADDKVLVLEDADRDGKAEKTTVFARGLLIPTGVEPGDGGAYVANSTELLHFKDTDGDGKADTRRVLLSGFGTEDTHHILHTLRWGYDGRLYFNQSIYIHSHVETPHGVRRLGGGGIWEFRPETMELGVFIRGLVNPWGHHFDRWGQSFATDGAGGEGINYCLPGAYYFTAPDAARILPGLNPGSPKDCGLEVVSGRHFPEAWQGNLLTNDFRGNRVCRYVLSDDGAGFASREQAELIKTPHVAFRPIDVKTGPDGAVYIADWYNPIIQHGEVDFRDPRRDHTRGRIWRVTAKLRRRRTVLALAVPGDFQANLPLAHLFDDATALHTLHLVDPAAILADPAAAVPRGLPPLDAVFIAIAEDREHEAALRAADAVAAATGAPVINRGSMVAALSRESVARRLRAIPGAIVPAQRHRSRAELGAAPPRFPLIVRPLGSHAGRDLARVADGAEFARYLAAAPGESFTVAPFVDSRWPDGLYRKIRVVFVDGKPYPLHLAIHDDWAVWYYNAGMDRHPERRAEEARFLADMEAAIGPTANRALFAIAREIGLDYVGLDAGLMPDGRLLVFEVETGMIVHDPGDAAGSADRLAAYRRIRTAVERMIDLRAGKNVGRCPTPRWGLDPRPRSLGF